VHCSSATALSRILAPRQPHNTILHLNNQSCEQYPDGSGPCLLATIDLTGLPNIWLRHSPEALITKPTTTNTYNIIVDTKQQLVSQLLAVLQTAADGH
jgi:hypothetical protein